MISWMLRGDFAAEYNLYQISLIKTHRDRRRDLYGSLSARFGINPETTAKRHSPVQPLPGWTVLLSGLFHGSGRFHGPANYRRPGVTTHRRQTRNFRRKLDAPMADVRRPGPRSATPTESSRAPTRGSRAPDRIGPTRACGQSPPPRAVGCGSPAWTRDGDEVWRAAATAYTNLH